MGIDDVFAVIAEGTRRQILERLREGDKAVGELVIELQVSQPTVSKHLKVLREAGLVTMRAQGQKRYYALETEPLERVRGWLGGFDGSVARPGTASVGEHSGPHTEEAVAATSTPGDTTSSRAPSPGTTADDVGPGERKAGQPAPDILAAAVLADPVGMLNTSVDRVTGAVSPVVSGAASDVREAPTSRTVPGLEGQRPGPQISRTMGRAAERAADLLSQLRRRRDTSS